MRRSISAVLLLTTLAACNSGGEQEPVAESRPTTTTTTAAPSTTTTAVPTLSGEQLPEAMLTIDDLATGWAEGAKAEFVSDSTGGFCGGPNQAARSEGNQAVAQFDAERDATVGPWFSETAVAFPATEGAITVMGRHREAVTTCDEFDDDGVTFLVRQQADPRLGEESFAYRQTVVDRRDGREDILNVTDTVYIRVGAVVLTVTEGTAYTTPDTEHLLAMSRNAVRRMEGQIP